MNRIPFDPFELEPIGYNYDGPFPNLNTVSPIFSSPISRKENFHLLLKGEKPLWMPHFNEIKLFFPTCVPDHVARAHVSTTKPMTDADMGGKDMFGVKWEYVPQVKGSMVRPGNPLVTDIEHWEDSVIFPDIDTWDWAGCAEETREMRSDGRLISAGMMSGLFERLISFVDMEDAMIAMIDEEAKPAVHRLFDRLCLLYDGILEHYKRYYDVDMVWFHDDWGSQRAPFFSAGTVREMLVPYLKRVVESAHKYGIIFNFHSCGQVEQLIPCMIEAGCDMWEGQNVNDKKKLIEQYGEKILINVDPEPLPEDVSVESNREALEAFVSAYKDLRAYSGFRPVIPEDEYKYVYEFSRIAYNS